MNTINCNRVIDGIAYFHYGWDEFCLNKESLEIRIENLKRQDIECNIEMAALAEINRQENNIEAN